MQWTSHQLKWRLKYLTHDNYHMAFLFELEQSIETTHEQRANCILATHNHIGSMYLCVHAHIQRHTNTQHRKERIKKRKIA